MQTEIARIAWEWAKKASPACAALVLLLGVVAYVYAGKELMPRAEAEQAHGEIQQEIQHGFSALAARMDLSDAQSLVRDLQTQIRAKEREIADLEMVIAEMENPTGESANVLRNRAFAARQDLSALQSQLSGALQDQSEAQRKYRQAAQ